MLNVPPSQARESDVDSVYEAAVKRADDLQLELKTLNDFIGMYRRTRHLLGLDSIEHTENTETETGVSVGEQGADESGGEPPRLTRQKRVTDNPSREDVARVARMILLENGHPMTRRELHTALADRGVVVRGADPTKTLGTMLWRAQAFDQITGKGYWPRGEQPADPELQLTPHNVGSLGLTSEDADEDDNHGL
jgi:hypothetical protein